MPTERRHGQRGVIYSEPPRDGLGEPGAPARSPRLPPASGSCQPGDERAPGTSALPALEHPTLGLPTTEGQPMVRGPGAADSPSLRERGQSGRSGSAPFSRDPGCRALGAFSNRDPLPLPLPPPLSRSEPPSAQVAEAAAGGGMAETDKPEVPGAASDDTPRQQLSPPEQPEESGQEQLQPQQELEKQQPPHGGNSNGVKMENDDSVKEERSDLKEKSTGNKKANRFHPYSKDKNLGTGEKKGPNRNRVFISNIPYDMKWQAIKDLMREKVGEVTYVELFKDSEGKSRGCGVVEFKDEEFVKKALETMNKYDLSGRPLNIKEDDKSVPHEDYRSHDSKTPQLPRGLGGIGMGLGPGGQPISANQLNMGGGMGNIGPGSMGMDGPGFGGMNRMGGGVGFGGMETMNSMGGFGGISRMGGMGAIDDFRGSMGSGMSGGIGTGMAGMGTGMGGLGSSMGELYRGGMASSMERDFGRGDIGMNRGFGDSFGRIGGAMIGGFAGGMGASNMGPVGSGMSGGMGGMNSMTGGMGMGLDRMSSSFDRMGPGMGAVLERSIDMDRGFVSGPMGSGMRDRIGSKGNQIFVRNLPFDLTWQKLKEKFSQCGHVMFAEIKMENGKSKGCGTVRFDSPESAEKACRIMNGIKISGREIDVRLDRNA